MIREELVFVATCDISGHVRGKGFPARELPGRLKKGIGWTGSNLMMSPAGPIWDTPFGTAGDLMIVPDPAAEVRVDFADGSAVEHFFLGDIRTTDGAAWECCPRDFLRRAARELEATAGLHLVAAFEQEFVYTGTDDRPGDAYALGAFRRQGNFGEAFIAALRAAGPVPDSFLAEYGPRQFEVTVAPQPALTAADHAVITREMARAAAHRLGHRVIFSPKPDPDLVGNGVHIHMSLWDGEDRPATRAAGEKLDLSKPAQHFFAGVLHHMPTICAVTAPSPVSYLRLTPNAWAPTVIDLVRQDRGASLRDLPGLRRRERRRNRAPVQCRVSRLRRLGQPLSGAGRGDLRRRRRHPPSPAIAGDGDGAALPALLARPGARHARRAANSPRNGSAPSIATPICDSNGSRRKRSRHCRRPNCAPTTPKYTDPMPQAGHFEAAKPRARHLWTPAENAEIGSWFPGLLLRSSPE